MYCYTTMYKKPKYWHFNPEFFEIYKINYSLVNSTNSKTSKKNSSKRLKVRTGAGPSWGPVVLKLSLDVTFV